MKLPGFSFVGVLLLFLSCGPIFGQSYSQSVKGSYARILDISYVQIGAWDGRLDVYSRNDATGPQPTLIYFHGGGAVGADRGKAPSTHDLLPYLEMGWNVVNVEWGVPGLTLAPIAVQNARCALHWVAANAEKYGFDRDRLVTSGFSSGGWLALTTAVVPRPAGWDACPEPADVKVAAVVNWSGQSDFADLLGPSARQVFKDWFQTLPDPMVVGKTVSPLNFVHAGMAPVISIHGDADAIVPYSQSVRLHEALRRAGAVEQFITVPGGKHGFTRNENEKAFAAVQAFLAKQNIVSKQ